MFHRMILSRQTEKKVHPKLDVYYPITPNMSGKTQIIFFIYGGGFISGERQYPAPLDLIQANVGGYFAHQGFLTIIPDYRLVPHVTFPAPAEDVRDAVLWAAKYPEHLTTPNSPNPDIHAMYLMSHSAGATHAFTALVLDTPESQNAREHVAGMIFSGGGLHYIPQGDNDSFFEIAKQYWGGAEEMKENIPMGLLRRASEGIIREMPRALMVNGQWEPEPLLPLLEEFRKKLEDRTGSAVKEIVGRGHNHLSSFWALGTGEGEDWAKEVIDWIS